MKEVIYNLILVPIFLLLLFPEENKTSVPPSTVTVLCYHQVRPWKKSDSKSDMQYIIPPETFASHLKLLHDSEYAVIGSDQITGLQKMNENLKKPVVITFDDGTESEFSNALPLLAHYGYKATFFIMTITLDKKNYLSSKQVKQLSDEGHLIGCHSWDHLNIKKYSKDSWNIQLKKSKELLEEITGKPVNYFAYPYGVWSTAAIEKLKEFGYKAAFQLQGDIDPANPVYTIKRILVDGNWSAKTLIKEIEKSKRNG